MKNEEKESKKDDKDQNGSNEKFKISFIINGEPTKVNVNVNAPLKVAVLKALEESENMGRPLEDWQVKFNGVVLDMNEKFEKLNIPNNSELFLSLKAGEGG